MSLNKKRILAIIPARGGSKGVKKKNIRLIDNKPLIAWTIEAASKSKYIDKLILSSDSDEIIEIAQNLGCEAPFKRPSELAKDSTPGIDTVLHAINMLPEYDYLVLLQPTSPLRNSEDIDLSIEKCILSDSNSLVSVTESQDSPHWMYTLLPNGFLKPVLEKKQNFDRRQDLPNYYVLNGAIYIADTDWIKESKSFIDENTLSFAMPYERSLDIDTEEDIEYFQFIISRNKNESKKRR